MDTTPGPQWTVERATREVPDGIRWEIDAGRLEVREPTGFYHGSMAARIAARLLAHVEAHGLGAVAGAETGFALARRPDTLLAPDVAFVSGARLALIRDPHAFPDVAPDLAVEVLSPTERLSAVRRKVAQYLAAGTRSVWVVDGRRRRLEQHLATGVVRVYQGDEVVQDPVLPGFRCGLGELLPAAWPPGDGG